MYIYSRFVYMPRLALGIPLSARNIHMNYEPVIGLEVHVQLRTRSKMFTRAATGYGEPPNRTSLRPRVDNSDGGRRMVNATFRRSGWR